VEVSVVVDGRRKHIQVSDITTKAMIIERLGMSVGRLIMEGREMHKDKAYSIKEGAEIQGNERVQGGVSKVKKDEGILKKVKVTAIQEKLVRAAKTVEEQKVLINKLKEKITMEDVSMEAGFDIVGEKCIVDATKFMNKLLTDTDSDALNSFKKVLSKIPVGELNNMLETMKNINREKSRTDVIEEFVTSHHMSEIVSRRDFYNSLIDSARGSLYYMMMVCFMKPNGDWQWTELKRDIDNEIEFKGRA
jgi:hypothetical protein